MKTLLILTLFGLTLFMAPGAWAVLDTDDDMMGMYWDLAADMPCVPLMYGPADLHIILTNPTMDAISGFECGISMETVVDPIILSYTFPNYNPLIPGDPQNLIIPFSTPLPCTEATVLVTYSIFNAAGVDIGFFLHEANPPSIPGVLPVILLLDGTIRQVGTSSLPGSVTAFMGVGCSVVATEEASWDRVKSLYR